MASANIVLDGDGLIGMAYVSDLYQRVARRRGWKTRVETVFRGWRYLLLNALLDYAEDNPGQEEPLDTSTAQTVRWYLGILF